MDHKPKQARENWGSRFGFIMAAAGSAVGLGNIWRFPYLAGENGGGAFLLIYLAFIVFIGFSIMLAEQTMGRMSQLSAVGAYKSVSPRFSFIGVLGVLTAFFIMGFYPVVGGWASAYIVKSATGLLASQEAIPGIFGAFVSGSWEPILWMLGYMAVNIIIVSGGVKDGIEKAAKVMMPLLFILLGIIAIRSITLPGAGEGLRFLFVPDWSKVDGSTVLAALGQAFFSLSLGMGCMITFGSYLGKDENLPQNASLVVGLDTTVALLAALAIFPALFAFGMEPAQGPGLVFVVVPQIFASMGGILGTLLSILFFVALTLAALTSSVSLLEVVVAYLIDQHNFDRKKATIATGIVMATVAVFASLSMGVLSDFHILGANVFDFLDILTDKIFMAIGGALLAIVVGWFVRKEDLQNEITNGGAIKFGLFNIWYFLMKFVIPVAIGIVAVLGIAAVEQTGLMIFGLGLIAVLAIFSRKL